MNLVRRIVPLALVAVLASSVAASAQSPKAPKAGERIVVKQTTSGEELRGRLIELSPDTLSLLVKGRRVDVPRDSVLRIDATGDSLVNGTVIGAAILGGLCALTCGQGLDSTDDLPAAVLASAGWGALFGALIDLTREGRRPIYIKAGPSGAAMQMRLRF